MISFVFYKRKEELIFQKKNLSLKNINILCFALKIWQSLKEKYLCQLYVFKDICKYLNSSKVH